MEDNSKLKVIFVQPMRTAKVIEIDNELDAMQKLVGGSIEEYMPFKDDVAIVCNEEGKLRELEPNRAVYDEHGQLQEVICGDFFLCYAPLDSDSYLSMPEDLKQKYEETFKYPEQFFMTSKGVKTITLAPKTQELER